MVSCQTASCFNARRPAVPHRVQASLADLKQFEVRICTNKTCKRQGSREVLKFGADLKLPNVQMNECGCLGNCGNGPNLVVLPDAMIVSHVSTVSHLARVLTEHCAAHIDDTVIQSTQLRLAGNMAAREGQLDSAIQLYTQAINMQPSSGIHLILSNRSGARLSQGDKEGALEDAAAATRLAPPTFITANIRLVDALYALGRYEEAADALSCAVEGCPDFKESDEYRLINAALRKSLRTKIRA